jgi:HPt (histidine-containing phosphotransfer) domain-containing protein
VAVLFVKHGQEYLHAIYGAVSAEDCEALRQAAHKLKGAAANLALVQLCDVAASIEAAAKTGNVEQASGLVSKLDIVYHQAVSAIEEGFGTA